MQKRWLAVFLVLFALLPLAHTVRAATTVWVDDALPAGATPAADGGDSWSWVSSNPTPFSGTLASKSNLASGEHQHYFYDATATLSVAVGDTLFAYVYLDPTNPPSEVMLQWNDGTWEHRAYWGANQILWGTDGTVSRRNMGALPVTGQWVKLSVPASQVGLEGHTLDGMAFTLYNGRATWDYGGKTTAAGSTPTSTSLVSSLNPSNAGQTVTFTATVTGSSPTGTINFTSDGTALCSGVPLNASQAQCSTSSLVAGTHSIVAAYSGDATNIPSTSPTLTQTVNSTVSGGNGVVSGPGSTGNTATGLGGTAGGQNSSASGAQGAPVAFGMAATASGDSGVAFGHQATAAGTDSLAFGRSSFACCDNSVSIGWGNVSDATQAWALGSKSTTRGVHGALEYGASESDVVTGDIQMGFFLPRVQTADATPTPLTTDGVGPTLSRQNVIVLPDHASYAFSGRAVARDLNTGQTATWRFEGQIRRAAGAASVVQGSTVTLVSTDVGSAWMLTVVADTANGGLALVGTGQTGRTIQWAAKVETVESVGGAN
jgi:Big-like domain-containing protein/trimeric autotransporter adhesin